MSIPTNDEIRTLLAQLDSMVADDLESAFLDFKPWRDAKKDMATAVEYAVCFANAEGGVVVFGVADRKRGRAAAIHGAMSYDLDVWRRGIYNATGPTAAAAERRFTFEEVHHGLASPEEAKRGLSCGVCNECDLCVTYCPDGVLKRVGHEFIFDYDYCKGCGICASECPRNVVTMSQL